MNCQYADSFPNESRRRPNSRGFGLARCGSCEEIQTPPGQECSNGSMIFLAVVLWRAFFARRARLPGRAADPVEP